MTPHRFPYTRIAVPFATIDVVKFRYHPLIKIGIVLPSASIKTECYIDTGAQWCLLNNSFAKQLGIKDYKKTEVNIQLSGVGGKKPENVAYFHKVTLSIFKDGKDFSFKNAWKIDTSVGFLDNEIGFSGILGVYGFLDQFEFTTNIPEGYFELTPLFDLSD